MEIMKWFDELNEKDKVEYKTILDKLIYGLKTVEADEENKKGVEYQIKLLKDKTELTDEEFILQLKKFYRQRFFKEFYDKYSKKINNPSELSKDDLLKESINYKKAGDHEMAEYYEDLYSNS